MNDPRIIAFGQEAPWLEAVKAAAGSSFVVEAIQASGDLLNNMASLPEADTNAIFLVDTYGQPNIEMVVRGLRDLGWQHIVVVATDLSVKEARAILRKNLAYDYWGKTFDDPVIRAQIYRCLDEIKRDSEAVPQSGRAGRQGEQRQ